MKQNKRVENSLKSFYMLKKTDGNCYLFSIFLLKQ